MELARQGLKEQIQAQAKKQFSVIGIIQQWTKTKTNNKTRLLDSEILKATIPSFTLPGPSLTRLTGNVEVMGAWVDEGNESEAEGNRKQGAVCEVVNFPLLEGSGISWMTICMGCCRVQFYPV